MRWAPVDVVGLPLHLINIPRGNILNEKVFIYEWTVSIEGFEERRVAVDQYKILLLHMGEGRPDGINMVVSSRTWLKEVDSLNIPYIVLMLLTSHAEMS